MYREHQNNKILEVSTGHLTHKDLCNVSTGLTPRGLNLLRLLPTLGSNRGSRGEGEEPAYKSEWEVLSQVYNRGSSQAVRVPTQATRRRS